MKTAMVVHGRFHAFDLARELIRAGEDVYVLTNYPKIIAEKFGIPPERVRTNLLHGVISRIGYELESFTGWTKIEEITHSWFSRWAAKIVQRGSFDIIHGFSGVCEELLRTGLPKRALHTLVRGSAHIETQAELLAEEEQRAGVKLEKPSAWLRAREAREYDLADLIFVLSTFAWQSFVSRGVDPARLRFMPLGSEVSRFRASEQTIRARSERIRSASPLRVLTVGTFSYRKGAMDLVEIARASCDFASFRFVGTVSTEAATLKSNSRKFIDFVAKVPQFDLPEHYRWGDLFLFPTIEDGFAVVLAQAAAAALPILATANCAAPDFIRNGKTGWIFPIRRPDLFIEQLKWCDQNRDELALIVDQTRTFYEPWDWSDVGRDFRNICASAYAEIIEQGKIDVARA